MNCPKCNCDNVTFEMAQTAGKTKRKGVGFGGHMNNTARGITAVCTLGVSNLFWKKSEGVNQTKFINETVAICQNCGNTWKA